VSYLLDTHVVSETVRRDPAATALHYDLRLVTRNARDFRYPDLEVVNPWLGESGT
jgi:predicted nucleic acid-binding protein